MEVDKLWIEEEWKWHTHTHTNMHAHSPMHIWLCVCVWKHANAQRNVAAKIYAFVLPCKLILTWKNKIFLANKPKRTDQKRKRKSLPKDVFSVTVKTGTIEINGLTSNMAADMLCKLRKFKSLTCFLRLLHKFWILATMFISFMLIRIKHFLYSLPISRNFDVFSFSWEHTFTPNT